MALVNGSSSCCDKFDDSLAYFEILTCARRLRANFKGLTSIYLGTICQDEEDYFEADGDYESGFNKAICQLAEALTDNNVVEKLSIDTPFSIHENTARAFAQSLKLNNSIKELTISTMSFIGEGSSEQIEMILKSLESNTAVAKLVVSGSGDSEVLAEECRLSERNYHAISSLIETNTSIKTLDMSWEILPYMPTRQIICNSLRMNKVVSLLDIPCNDKFAPGFFLKLCSAMEGHGRIKCVNTILCKAAKQLVRFHDNVEEINLHLPYINSGWCIERGFRNSKEYLSLELLQFASFLRNNDLNTICIQGYRERSHRPQCSIDHQSLSTFCSAITKTCITTLRISGIHLGDKGAHVIASGFSSIGSALRSLDLHDCGVGDDGATAIAELLARKEYITSINLGSNQIGDVGAKCLFQAMSRRNLSMTEVILFDNNILSTGCAAAIPLLQNERFQLEHLNLTSNAISFETYLDFGEALKKNCSLKRLSITRKWERNEKENGLSVLAKFIDALQHNHHLNVLNFHLSGLDIAETDMFPILSRFESMLFTNHSLCRMYFPDSLVEYEIDYYLEINDNHEPILASVIKGAPFPAYLVKDLPDTALPSAIHRVGNIADLDGLYSFVTSTSGWPLGDAVIRPSTKRAVYS